MAKTLLVRNFGLCPYSRAYGLMACFTDRRDDHTPDELWHMEHPPVFTLGLAAMEEHVLDRGDIPVTRTDRGGQVTYHGPGQLVVYLLLDLGRKGMTVKQYIYLLEQAVIDMCLWLGIRAERKSGAPGVYVEGKKIAALGIRVRRGCSYHGLALNVEMDLEPFRKINPCGFPDLEITQLRDLGCRMNINEVFERLLPYLMDNLGYSGHQLKRTGIHTRAA